MTGGEKTQQTQSILDDLAGSYFCFPPGESNSIFNIKIKHLRLEIYVTWLVELWAGFLAAQTGMLQSCAER